MMCVVYVDVGWASLAHAMPHARICTAHSRVLGFHLSARDLVSGGRALFWEGP